MLRNKSTLLTKLILSSSLFSVTHRNFIPATQKSHLLSDPHPSYPQTQSVPDTQTPTTPFEGRGAPYNPNRSNPNGFSNSDNGFIGENQGVGYQQNGVHFGGFQPNSSHGQAPGFYDENPTYQEFSQSPTAQNGYGNSGLNLTPIYHGSVGGRRESPLQEGQQSSSQFPLVNGMSGDNAVMWGPFDELDELCKAGKVKEAIVALGLLRSNGVVVDLERYLTLMRVCGEGQFIDEARTVHGWVSCAFGGAVAVNNKILDMYCKCGLMADAYELFEKMPQRNLTSWDTMLAGCVYNELGEEAIDLFTEFKELGLKPDGGLFVSVLNACSVLGAVDEGMLHLGSMKVEFGRVPTMQHYVSIVDMLGQSGYLDEALDFIEKMPVEPSVDVWETLMNLCRANGYEELGNRCFEIVEQLDSSRLTDQAKMGLLPLKAYDNVMKRKKNSPPDNTRHIHNLRAGDRSHPETDRIYALIGILMRHMKEAGYSPDLKPVLHDIDEESKEEALFAHSERLATAYSLLTTPARSLVRILKNLRFCRDCHETMKYVSKLTGRTLIIRDAKRFHHFTDGVCSCNDYY